MKIITIFLFIVALVGCSSENEPLSLELLAGIQNANPVDDAKKSLVRRDFRFIAVHNHDLIMPLNIKPCLVDSFDYRILTNQSYDYGSYSFQKYGAIATLYSNWYNFTILSYLQDNGLSGCDNSKSELTE